MNDSKKLWEMAYQTAFGCETCVGRIEVALSERVSTEDQRVVRFGTWTNVNDRVVRAARAPFAEDLVCRGIYVCGS